MHFLKQKIYILSLFVLIVSAAVIFSSSIKADQKKENRITHPLTQKFEKKAEWIQDWLLPNSNSKERTQELTHAMIHFTSNAVANPKNPYQEEAIYQIFTDYGLSSHYMINRNGDIYRLVNESRVAFHAGKGSLPGFPAYQDKMNEYAIGIELFGIGTWEEMSIMMSKKQYDLIHPSDIGFTNAQYISLNRLLNAIYKRNPSILKDREHVIGHDEYAPGRKTDPGSLFNWSKIGFEK